MQSDREFKKLSMPKCILITSVLLAAGCLIYVVLTESNTPYLIGVPILIVVGSALLGRLNAIFYGFAVALALMLLDHYTQWSSDDLVHFLLPAIFGSLITGYVARKNGWLYGLLVGILCQTLGAFLFWFMIGAPWDWIIGSVTIIWYMWHRVWLRVLSVLIAGMLCGHLGQLLAQKWRKKSVC